MANTAKGIYYPTVGSKLAPLAGHFAQLATSVDTALGNITPGGHYTGTDAQRIALTAPSLRKGITWYTTDTNLMYLYNGTAWTLWQRAPAPYAIAAGVVATTASGVATVTFPAGRFSQPPVVTLAAYGHVNVLAEPRMTAPPTTTGFSIHVFTMGGGQVPTTVAWHAIQMTASASAG